ncbi:hypothetical protein DS837_28160 [Azospirillum brasilense]|uniref:Uncharacterized protein n=1 Tax=Azospirillum brasilense TaxID=192 RepID=A0A6L3ASQ1_AZOBR|nr:hypothetical protein DS837_28160 [Azospirillum brasilense]
MYLYLTAAKRLFVNPQFPLLVDGREFVPDFVALDPMEKRVWLVEVSWAKSGDKILKKCRDYARHEAQIREQLGAGCPPDWKIGLWLFLKSETAAAVSSKTFSLGDMTPRVETLEKAVAVWEWSQVKPAAEEPHRLIAEPV